MKRGNVKKMTKLMTLVATAVLVFSVLTVAMSTVNAAVYADNIEVTVQPENTTAGETIMGPPTVEVTADGNPVEDAEVDVTAYKDGDMYEFDMGENETITGTDGVAEFNDLVINTTGAYTLNFTVENLEDDNDPSQVYQESELFNIEFAEGSLAPEDDEYYEDKYLEGFDWAFDEENQVIDFGNIVDNQSYPYHTGDDSILLIPEDPEGNNLTSDASFEFVDVPEGAVGGGYTISAYDTGSAGYLVVRVEDGTESDEFSWHNYTLGDYTVEVTDAAGHPDFNFTFTIDSLTFAEHLETDYVEIIEEDKNDVVDDIEIEAGTDLAFDATAYDKYDNLVSDATDDFSWKNATRGDFTKRLNETYQVTATYDTEDVTSEPTNVTVTPSDAVSIEIEPQEASIEAGENQSYTVTAYDEYGNDFDVTEKVKEDNWTISSAANASFEYDEITETMNLTVNESGTWGLNATYEELYDNTAKITVGPAEVANVYISPSDDQEVGADTPIEFSAEARDEYENLITDDVTQFTWENASDQGVFHETEPGDYNVSATYDGEWANITVTVTVGDVDSVVITPDTDQTVTAGEELNFTAEAYDAYGNLITDDVTQFTWENIPNENITENENATFYEEEAGEYIVNATSNGVSSADVVVTVEPAAVDTVEIKTVEKTVDGTNTVTITAGQEVNFTVIVNDTYDNQITNYTENTDLTWENITYHNSSENWAVFAETDWGDYDVSANYSGVTDNVTVYVEKADVDYVDIYPYEDQTIIAGNYLNFTAEAYDAYDNMITNDSMDFDWENTDDWGNFTKTEAGEEYTVNATHSGSDVTSEDVTVTVTRAEVDTVTITNEDGTTTITAGDIVNFTVEAEDAYGNPIDNYTENFTWENIGYHNNSANWAVFDETAPGDYDVTATYVDDEFDTEVTSTSDTVTVEAGPVDSVELDPSEDQVLVLGEEILFDAYAYDSEDNLLADDVADFDWDNASSNGVFFAEDVGEYNVTATYDGETSEPTLVKVYEELYTLNVTTDGGGTVEIDPDMEEYEPDTEVNLTAIADEHWEFVNWTGDYEGTEEEINIMMDSDKTLTATFEENTYTLNVTTEGEGTVDIDPDMEEYEPNDEVNLTASPADGWEFVEWTGDVTGTDSTVTITMDSDKSVTAVFEEIPTYQLTVNTDGDGSVVVDPDQTEYEEGTEVTLTADPADGWNFVEWTGDATGTDSTVTITMDSDKSVTAVFEEEEEPPAEYDLTISIDGEGSTDPAEGTHTYTEGETVTVEATPAEGWQFVEWTGDETGTDATIDITMDSDKSITAVFEEEVVEYDLTINIDGEGSTDPAEGTHTYEEGEEVTITASAADGWEFVEWTGDESGTETDITVTVDEDMEITAVFEEVEEEEEDGIPGFTTMLLVLASVIAVAIYYNKKEQ